MLNLRGNREEDETDACLSYIAEFYMNGTIALVNNKADINVINLTSGLQRTVYLAGSNYNSKYLASKPRNLIFFLEDHDDLKKIRTSSFWNPKGRIVVVAKTLRRGFVNLWTWTKALNLVFVIGAFNEFQIFTWFPYSSDVCKDEPELVQQDVWHDGRFTHHNALFPKKLPEDFCGCPVTVTTSSCAPYVTDGLDYGFGGMETFILKTIAKYHNFSIRFKAVPNGQSHHINRLENGTLVGAIGMLVRQEADVAYSCLMVTEERCRLAEVMPCHMQDSLSWFVPAPRSMPPFSGVYSGFRPILWVSVISVFICVATVVFVTTGLEKNKKLSGLPGVLNVISVSFNLPPAYAPNTCLQRYLLFSFSLYAFHIAVAYQSSLLINLVTDPYERPFRTSKEAVAAGLHVYLRPSMKALYDQFDNDVWKQILQKERHTITERFDYRRAVDQRDAMYLHIKSCGQFEIASAFPNKRFDEVIFIIKEQYVSYPAAFFISPGNPLAYIFQPKIQQIVEAGLPIFWIKNDTQKLQRGRRKGTQQGVQQEKQPLEPDDFLGAFCILFLSYFACLLAFIGELIVHRTYRKKEKKRLKLRKRIKHSRRIWLLWFNNLAPD